jgi:hypothetical protein
MHTNAMFSHASRLSRYVPVCVLREGSEDLFAGDLAKHSSCKVIQMDGGDQSGVSLRVLFRLLYSSLVMAHACQTWYGSNGVFHTRLLSFDVAGMGSIS